MRILSVEEVSNDKKQLKTSFGSTIRNKGSERAKRRKEQTIRKRNSNFGRKHRMKRTHRDLEETCRRKTKESNRKRTRKFERMNRRKILCLFESLFSFASGVRFYCGNNPLE